MKGGGRGRVATSETHREDLDPHLKLSLLKLGLQRGSEGPSLDVLGGCTGSLQRS